MTFELSARNALISSALTAAALAAACEGEDPACFNNEACGEGFVCLNTRCVAQSLPPDMGMMGGEGGEAGGGMGGEPAGGGGGMAGPDPAAYHEDEVMPVVQARCAPCHQDGPGFAAPLYFFDAPEQAEANYQLSVDLSIPGDPDGSSLLAKGRGESNGGTAHGGGDLLVQGTADDDVFVTFINMLEGGGPMGGMPMGGMPVGGEPIGGEPIGGEPVGGEPVGGEPVGGMPVGGEPVGGMPVGGEPVGGMPAPDPRQVYDDEVNPILNTCAGCHPAGGARQYQVIRDAAAEADLAANYQAALNFVVPGDPARSVLLTKGRGEFGHPATAVSSGSPQEATLISWIELLGD